MERPHGTQLGGPLASGGTENAMAVVNASRKTSGRECTRNASRSSDGNINCSIGTVAALPSERVRTQDGGVVRFILRYLARGLVGRRKERNE